MKVVYSEDQLQHDVEDGAWMGEPEPYHERPERVTEIIDALRSSEFSEFVQPGEHGLDPLRRVHSDAYLQFLQTLWQQSRDAGERRDALFPSCYAPHGMEIRQPASVDGLLGYFSFDTSAPITADSWVAAKASANTVLTAQGAIASGERTAFALCRPPGHHAGRDYCGG
ncbi:MAG: histone deacetylase family protein, partial [Pseudomonadota bacterium]